LGFLGWVFGPHPPTPNPQSPIPNPQSPISLLKEQKIKYKKENITINKFIYNHL